MTFSVEGCSSSNGAHKNGAIRICYITICFLMNWVHGLFDSTSEIWPDMSDGVVSERERENWKEPWKFNMTACSEQRFHFSFQRIQVAISITTNASLIHEQGLWTIMVCWRFMKNSLVSNNTPILNIQVEITDD